MPWIRPGRWSGVATILLVLAILVPAVAVTTGSPPPVSVCEPCNENLEISAEQHGIGLDVTRSTATMRVHENGSATWTITSHYEPRPYDADADVERRNISALATDPVLRRNVALHAIDVYDGADPGRLRSVRANDTAMSFLFRENDIARKTPGGVLVVDTFHTGGHGTGWIVDVTRLRIVGPDGTVIANNAAGAIGGDIATDDDGTLTLSGNVGAGYPNPSYRPAFSNDVYVAFAQPGPAAGPLTDVGVAIATLPLAIEMSLNVHLLGLVVLLSLLGLARRRRGKDGPDRRITRRWAAASVAVYLVVTLLIRPPNTSPGLYSFVLTTLFVVFGIVIGLANWFAYDRVEEAPA